MTKIKPVYYEGNYYTVSNSGIVRSVFYGRDLVQFKNNRGYVLVRMNKKSYLVSRLVATEFIPNPHNLPCVNHKNGDKNDNSSKNLEWVTY